MGSYKYTARGFAGERKEGIKEASSSNDIIGWLRKQGLTPVAVTEISPPRKNPRRQLRRRRIKSSELAAFCWQLTTMIEGGIPVTTALDTIAQDIDNFRFQQILKQIAENIKKGESFSISISKFPTVFNRLAQAMILAGETGGTLAETLARLATYFDNRDKLAKKVKGAMAYPTFVLTFIILIVIFIMTFIIPRFRIIFDQIGGQLPAFTRAFMGFYDLLRNNLVYILGSLVLLIILAALAYSRSKKGHYLFCRIALAVPLLGKILSQAFVAVFCRTMSALISAGVSVLEVFDILSEMTGNDIIKNAVIRTRENIVQGENISSSMSAAGFFPNMVVKMTQVGEESGSLSDVLDKTADYYERKVDSTIGTVMALLEPMMIVTVGAIVLVVVLALYLPIFSMSNVTR